MRLLVRAELASLAAIHRLRHRGAACRPRCTVSAGVCVGVQRVTGKAGAIYKLGGSGTQRLGEWALARLHGDVAPFTP